MKLSILAKNEAILLTISCLFAGFFASGILHMVISRLTSSQAAENMGLILGEAAMLLPLFFALRLRQQRLKTFIPWRPLSRSKWLTIIIFGVGALLILDGVSAILDQFFTIPEWLQSMEEGLLWHSNLELILLIIAGVIVAPIIEELIFRGLLQQAMAGHYQVLLPALVGPAVFFTIFHVQYLLYPPAAIELLLLALTFGWIMGKTGNLLAPILMHALNNLVSLVWLGVSIDSYGLIRTDDPGTWGWFFLGAILMAGAGWQLNKEPDFIPFAIISDGKPAGFRDKYSS